MINIGDQGHKLANLANCLGEALDLFVSICSLINGVKANLE